MRSLIVGTAVMALWAVLANLPPSDLREQPPAPQVLEIRAYNLKPGSRDRFHQRFEQESLPMLRRWKVDVVAYGPSRHDADSWYLMRAFAGVDARQKSEDAFYASDEWRNGPRDAVLADIVNYTTVVIDVDEAALRAIRSTQRR